MLHDCSVYRLSWSEGIVGIITVPDGIPVSDLNNALVSKNDCCKLQKA